MTVMEDEVTIDSLATTPHNRRRFMAGAGAAGLGLVAAACGSESSSSSGSSSGGGSASGGGSGDAAIAMTAAGLEVLAVGTYKAALDAAQAKKLGAVPPAVATFAQTAMSQHQSALDKWNGVLTQGGGQAVSQPPADLKTKVDQAFAQVTDVTGVAKLALMLEQIAAQTYLVVLPKLQNKDAISLAGSIQVIDQQHQSILLYVLGQYPVPEVFQKTDMAVGG